MESFYSIAGVIAILFSIFSLSIPFIYPRYTEYVEDNLYKNYSFLFWSFFLSYFFMGSWLIVANSSKIGLILLVILILLYALIYKKTDIYSVVSAIVFKYILSFYIFNLSVLIFGIYIFYAHSVIDGAIISYSIILYFFILIGSFAFLLYKKKSDKTTDIKADIEGHSLSYLLDFFNDRVNKTHSDLLFEIEYILSGIVELVYVGYVPEELYSLDPDTVVELIQKYILSETTISETEKKVIKELIEQRKKLIKWKKDFDEKIINLSDAVNILPSQKNKTKKTTNKPPKQAGK